MSEFGSHRARKRFGQNFLVDQSIINRIVEAIDPQPGQHIVEIGPGQAAITRKLINALGANGSIDAIEIDRDLVARLTHEFDVSKLRVHQADAAMELGGDSTGGVVHAFLQRGALWARGDKIS